MKETKSMIQLLFFLLVSFPYSTSTTTTSTPPCNRTCNTTIVQYPFGFSSSCPIPLTCSSTSTSTILLSNTYTIRNITSNGTLLINLPPSCTRPSNHNLDLLNSTHFSLTSHTGLFLRNCTTTSGLKSNCTLPTSTISQMSRAPDCDNGNDSITCFSDVTSATGLLTSLPRKCRELYTAVLYAFDVIGSEQPGLVIGVAELRWWMTGACTCVENARCTSVVTGSGEENGYLCMCNEGFVGDGYADGEGCVQESSDCSTSNSCYGHVGLLVGGITACIATLLGLAFLFTKYLQNHSKSHSTRRLLSGDTLCDVPLYSYRDMARATNSFSHTQRLGTGAYGTVYAGKLPSSSSLVAIKRLKYRAADENDASALAAMINEIKLVSSVDHPNLIKLLGCCLENGEQMLVYEFMPNGTLAQQLHREQSSHAGLPWRVRLAIASETAQAIAHLHSMRPPIYHRDIKSSNILLDREFRPKLADFGLSRAWHGWANNESHISTAPQGTPGYVDPEYHQNFHLSDKSDVYSFGVVLLELMSAMKVVDFTRTPGEVNLASLALDRIAKGRVEEIVDPVLVDREGEWVMESIQNVAELAFRCLAFQKDVRPCIGEVVDELGRIVDSSPENGVRVGSSISREREGEIVHEIEGFRVHEGREMTKTKRWVNMHSMRFESPVSVQEVVWASEQSSPSTFGSMPRFIG